MAAIISWRMGEDAKPPNQGRWERLINEWYGDRSGHVEIALVIQGQRWRVDLAQVNRSQAYRPGDHLGPPHRDVRPEVTELLQDAGLPVD